MFILILSLLTYEGSTQLVVQEMSSKEACHAAGRLFEKQHSARDLYPRWSCTPK